MRSFTGDADQEDEAAERGAVIQQRGTDQLVHRVVPPDIFAQGFQFALKIEDGGGVQTSRAVENTLCPAQPIRQRMNHSRVKLMTIVREYGTLIRLKIVEGGFST